MSKVKFIVVFCVLSAAICLSNQQYPYNNQPYPYAFNQVPAKINPVIYPNQNNIVTNLPLTRENFQAGTIHYYTGYRSGANRILAQSSNKFVYTNNRDVEQAIWFPNTGSRSPFTISFIEIWVEQNSQLGEAVITNGGVNQNFVNLLIRAKQVRNFSYRVIIYGY